jgi:hypothetical protein
MWKEKIADCTNHRGHHFPECSLSFVVPHLAPKDKYTYANKTIVDSDELPPELNNALLERHIRAGDTVIDLFAGSGSFTGAALMLGCNPIAVEKDDEKFRGIVARMRGLVEVHDVEEEKEVEANTTNTTTPPKTTTSTQQTTPSPALPTNEQMT